MEKQLLSKAKIFAYMGGIVLIITALIYAFTTFESDFFNIEVNTQEKKDVAITIASGVVLLLEGGLLDYLNKNSEKSMLLIVLCVISVISFVADIVWHGISQIFSYIGVMNLLFGIINVLILVAVLRNKKID